MGAELEYYAGAESQSESETDVSESTNTDSDSFSQKNAEQRYAEISTAVAPRMGKFEIRGHHFETEQDGMNHAPSSITAKSITSTNSKKNLKNTPVINVRIDPQSPFSLEPFLRMVE